MPTYRLTDPENAHRFHHKPGTRVRQTSTQATGVIVDGIREEKGGVGAYDKHYDVQTDEGLIRGIRVSDLEEIADS